MKALCIYSPYIRLYSLCVEPAPTPALRLRHSVQGMRRDHSCPGRNHARQLDCRRLPIVWNKEALPAIRSLEGLTVAQASWRAASRGGELMGEMRRAIAREEQDRRTQDRFASTIVIAASIIAAVRLAREPDISRPSPRLTSVIADSVGLARMILERVVR